MSDNRHLIWLNTTGGPFLLLERNLLRYWNGNVELSGDQTSEDEPKPTDYDRACSVEDYVGVISVDSGQALVLGDEPMQTAWWVTGAEAGVLIRWRWATSEDAIVEAMSDLPDDVWEDTGVSLSLPQGDLVLFDSSCRFDEIDSSLSIRLSSGNYSVHTAEYQPNSDVSLVLHRLAPAR